LTEISLDLGYQEIFGFTVSSIHFFPSSVTPRS